MLLDANVILAKAQSTQMGRQDLKNRIRTRFVDTRVYTHSSGCFLPLIILFVPLRLCESIASLIDLSRLVWRALWTPWQDRSRQNLLPCYKV